MPTSMLNQTNFEFFPSLAKGRCPKGVVIIGYGSSSSMINIDVAANYPVLFAST